MGQARGPSNLVLVSSGVVMGWFASLAVATTAIPSMSNGNMLTAASIRSYATDNDSYENVLNRTVFLPIVALSSTDSDRFKRRLAAVRAQMKRLGVTSVEVAGGSGDLNHEVRCFNNVVNALHECTKDEKHDFCLVHEDDTALHTELSSELAATLAVLPTHWQMLHLCPGFSSGSHARLPGWKAHKFHLNPEDKTCAAANHGAGAGRIFSPQSRCFGCFGGPVAFLVRKGHAQSVLELLAGVDALPGVNVDCVLEEHREETHFVAREPQLCYERLDAESAADATSKPL